MSGLFTKLSSGWGGVATIFVLGVGDAQKAFVQRVVVY